MVCPKYPLAKALGFSLCDLQKLAKDSDKYCKPTCIPKKDGDMRTVTVVKQPLNSVLKKIKNRILDKVVYPDYLHGSIKKRAPATNVRPHIGARGIINLDIKNFFPSVNHKKTNVAGPTKTKCVTGLKIGNKIGIPTQYIATVNRDIKKLEKSRDLNRQNIQSIKGKINHIRQFDPKQATRLESTLEGSVKRCCKINVS